MVKLKLFDGEEAPEGFVKDFKIFMKLPKGKKDTLISLIGKSDYTRYYCFKKNELAKALGLEEETAHGVFHVVVLLLKGLIKDELPEADILLDIKELGGSDGQIKELKSILKQTQTSTFKKQFIASFQAQLELESTLPIWNSLECVIDQRIVTNDGKVEGEILKTIPVVILRITNRYRGKKETMVIQSTIEDLEYVIGALQEMLRGLKKLKSTGDIKI
ncbi:MAG: hypothetical protein L6243_07130 [Candidatus Altiarchaeales archaeon]|nr:hypothetical protein [Candidatus Altiarchaeota archaeon]MCG2783344.1 hypothetical protein [Candidatus Altiarchaeales archaeon]